MRITSRLSCFQGASDMEKIAAAMHWLVENPGAELIIEPGVYDITTPLAVETMQKVLSGAYGANPQRTMFNPKFAYSRGMSLAGQKNTKISAYGATFMVYGFMEPVSVIDCEDVEICGLTIDHKRKPYTRGVVTEVEPVEVDGDAYYRIELTLDADSPLEEGTPIRLRDRFYDPVGKRYVKLGKKDIKVIDKHHLSMLVSPDSCVATGLEYYTVHTFHFRPAVLIERARKVTLTDVTIHSQPGMGIVGNRSEDILLRRVFVIPSLSHHWSTNTDATHFTSVKGTLRYENCMSEGHGDDFINVHGYYQDVVERIDSCTCIMQEKTPDGTHAQTLDYPDVDDTLELVDRETLLTKDVFTVVACEPMHEKWCCRVQLDHPLPKSTDQLMLADVTRLPRVEVVGCTITAHRARGILIKSRNVLIERNCIRDVDMAGIEIAAESRWSEGVCPCDVIIRGNRIENCGDGILIKADSRGAKGQSIRNIVVEDNIIAVPDACGGISARNVDGLYIRRNKIVCDGPAVRIDDCTGVDTDM